MTDYPQYLVTRPGSLDHTVSGIPEVLPDGTLLFRKERSVPYGRSSAQRNVITRAYGPGQWSEIEEKRA